MTHRCCNTMPDSAAAASGGSRGAQSGSRSWLRRGFNLGGWVVPAWVLVFLPKCPACVAAYLAVGAGIGVSVSTASYLRMALVGLCGVALVWMMFRSAYQLVAKTRQAAASRAIL